MVFDIITITDNSTLNYFFTFPIYVTLISIPSIAIIRLFRSIL